MIISSPYFIGKLNLPQVGNDLGATDVEQFISDYEPEYLKSILGYDLWKAFTEGTEGSGTPDQRWIDLLDGKGFTYCGKLNKWEGFNTSPIQNYVYYQFMDDLASNTSLVGGVAPATDNSKRVNSMAKMVDAWNRMVDINEVLWQFLTTNLDVYPEYESYLKSELFNKKNTLDL